MNQKLLIVIIILIIIVGAVLWLLPDTSPSDTTTPPPLGKEMGEELSTSAVEYGGGNRGYLAKPSSEGTYPGLVLIHEWWGLNDNIRDLAEQFAREGYVALAVDLYGGEVTEDATRARELATSVRGDMEGAFANLRGAVSYLQSLPEVKSDSLASVGWCFGGGWSYQMAKNDLGVDASVIYYGQFNPEDDLAQMRASILGHFGEDDTSISVDDVNAFQATLQTLSGNHEIFIYPNAGHGFANDGDRYAPEAAKLAWKRTVSFLGQMLR